jgi:hypothetical protein
MNMHEKPRNPYSKQWEYVKEIFFAENESSNTYLVLRFFLLVIAVGLMAMPAMFIRLISGKTRECRKIWIELYACTKPLLFLFILLWGYTHFSLWVFFTAYFLIDLYLYLFGLIFLRKLYTPPASHDRSLVLLGINFIESILGFAVLYSYSQSIMNSNSLIIITRPLDQIYFSCITAATIGYGDMIPATPFGKVLVILQALSSMLFVSVFISRFVGNLQGKMNS